MDAPVYHSRAPIQVIRDRQGFVIGKLEEQRATGKILARDARGVIVGAYDPHQRTTRDARGLIVARGNVLAALLMRR